MNEINREQSIKVDDKPAKTFEWHRDRQRSNPKSYGRVESGNEPVTLMTSLGDPLPSQSGVANGDSATTATVNFLLFSTHAERKCSRYSDANRRCSSQHQPGDPVMTIILTTTGKKVRKSTEIDSETPSTSSKRRRRSERNLIKTSR